MVSVGGVEFTFGLDTSTIPSEVARLNNQLRNQAVVLPVELGNPGQVRQAVQGLQSQARAQSITVPIQVETSGIQATQQAVDRVRAAIAASTQQANNLVSQFGLSAREANLVARAITQVQREAARSQQAIERFNLRNQEQEARAFAREFERAAIQAERLANSQRQDTQLASQYQLSAREARSITEAITRVRAETQQAEQQAALLRSQFGLTDDEVSKVQGSLNRVTEQTRNFGDIAAIAIGNFASTAAFAALDAVISSLRNAGTALAGVFESANQQFQAFEGSLTTFRSRAQGVSVDLNSLQDEIVEVATITSQTPATVAELAVTLTSLGVEAVRVEESLRGITVAADLLGEDPVITGRVIQGGLESYRQFGETTDSLTDLLVRLINTTAAGSRGGIAEFEQLFSKTAPVAATLGVEIEVLASAFAGLRQSGATAEVAATSLEAVLNALVNRSRQLNELGVEVQFDAEGGVDLVATLQAIRSEIDGLNQVEQVATLSEIFGAGQGSDVLALINQLDGAFASALESAGQRQGEVSRSLDIVNQSLERQIQLLEGEYAAGLLRLGEAIAPARQGFINLQREILASASIDLDPLTQSAQRLGAALSDPQFAEPLTEALNRLAQVGVDALVAIIDNIADLAQNEQVIRDITSALNALATTLNALGSFVTFSRDVSRATDGVIQSIAGIPVVGGAAIAALNTLVPGFENIARVSALARESFDRFRESLGGIGPAISEAAASLDQALSNLSEQAEINIGISEETTPQFDLEGRVEEFDRALSEIESRSAQSQAILLGQDIPEEQIAIAEREALQERIANRERFLAELQSLGETGDDDVSDQVLQQEQQLNRERLQLAAQLRRERVTQARAAADEVIEQLRRERSEAQEAEGIAFQSNQDRIRAQGEAEIANQRRALESEIASQQRALARELAGEERALQTELQAQERAFDERQRAEEEAFQNRLAAERQRADREFGALDSEVDRRFRIQSADPDDRATVEAQIQAEIQAAELRREIEEDVLRERQRVLSNADLDLSPLEQARADFEARLQDEEAAFQAQQDQQRLDFQDQIAQAQLANEEIIGDRKLAIEARIDELKLASQQQIEARELALQQQLQSLEREFREQQRQLDQANAQQIAQILSNAQLGILPTQSLRDGGLVGPGLTQVHDGEFVFTPSGKQFQIQGDPILPIPVGSYVMSQTESRRIAQMQAPQSLIGSSVSTVGTVIDPLTRAIANELPIQTNLLRQINRKVGANQNPVDIEILRRQRR